MSFKPNAMPESKKLFDPDPINLPFIDSRLAELPGLQAIDLAELHKGRGVYFLMYDNIIVYVGQTINVFSRIQGHISEGTKEFNNVYFLPVPCGDLLAVEKKYILQFLPKYNQETKWAQNKPHEAKHVSLALN